MYCTCQTKHAYLKGVTGGLGESHQKRKYRRRGVVHDQLQHNVFVVDDRLSQDRHAVLAEAIVLAPLILVSYDIEGVLYLRERVCCTGVFVFVGMKFCDSQGRELLT
jgi:hypothetical protein